MKIKVEKERIIHKGQQEESAKLTYTNWGKFYLTITGQIYPLITSKNKDKV